MQDTISRQAAIDATWFEPSYTDPLNVLTEVRDRLKVLPPAQPERMRGKWIERNPLNRMNDLISRQAVLDFVGSMEMTDQISADAYKELTIYLEGLLSEPVGNSDTLEWIPCSERLPEKDEEVLVYLFGDSPHLAWFDGHKWQTEDFTVDDDERPIAWLRLPKPWEGESDD